MTDAPLLEARGLVKAYRTRNDTIPVLHGVDLRVEATDFVCVVGASGSGKSTLLHLLGTLDQPDAGEVHFEGQRIDNAPAKVREAMRNGTFGFVFQFYHLLPELTALENVLVPAMVRHSFWGWGKQKRLLRERAEALLERVGLAERMNHRPSQMSGGEMQRATIARALVNEPRLLFADEPTGNLDEARGLEIVQLLRDLNAREGLTIVMVTHNMDLVAESDRVVRLVKGLVVERDGRAPQVGDGPAPAFSGPSTTSNVLFPDRAWRRVP